MGTRGLVGWVVDDVVKATYNHFDSYPSELGSDVMQYIVSRMDAVEAWREKVRQVDLLTDDPNAVAPPEVVDRARELELINMDVGGGEGIDTDDLTIYRVLRNAQGRLDIYEKVGVIENAVEFANDSLFCEWGWLVNLDDGVLEVYRGFQREPHEQGRFASPEDDRGYWPIALLDTIKFVDLLPGPDESIEHVIGLECARLESKAYPDEEED